MITKLSREPFWRYAALLAACGTGIIGLSLGTLGASPSALDWPTLITVVWFAFVAIVVLCASKLSDPLAYLIAVSIPILPISLGSALQQVASEHRLSPGVAVCQTAVLAIFLLAILAPSNDGPRGRARIAHDWRSLGFGKVLFGALVIALVGWVTVSQVQRLRVTRWLDHQERRAIPGVPTAKVVVVLFTDYQCPFCKIRHFEFDPIISELVSRHPGEMVFKKFDFPLSVECNAEVPQTLHPAACPAAVVVRLAEEIGMRATAEDYLFTHQEQMTPAFVEAFAASLGIHYSERYQQVLAAIQEETAVGRQAGVTGTPAYFVNGIAVGQWDKNSFRAALENELRR